MQKQKPKRVGAVVRKLRARQAGDHAPAQLPPPTFHLVVPCRDETDQHDLYEELRGRGYRPRVLSI